MPTPKPRPSTSRPPAPTSRAASARDAAPPATSRSTTSRSSSTRVSASSSRTADLSGAATKSRPKSAAGAPPRAPNANDPGVKRRAAKRQQSRRKNLLVWTAFLAVSVVISGMTLGVWNGKGRYQDAKHRLVTKQATLHDLKVQLENAKRRFAAMSSDAGKHRTLVENGFLRDDERLLLFPMDKSKDRP